MNFTDDGKTYGVLSNVHTIALHQTNKREKNQPHITTTEEKSCLQRKKGNIVAKIMEWWNNNNNKNNNEDENEKRKWLERSRKIASSKTFVLHNECQHAGKCDEKNEKKYY